MLKADIIKKVETSMNDIFFASLNENKDIFPLYNHLFILQFKNKRKKNKRKEKKNKHIKERTTCPGFEVFNNVKKKINK